MIRRFLPIAASAAVLVSVASPARADYKYGWTISDSRSDPLSNVGTFTGGVTTLFLWFYCGDQDGMAAAEFDLEGDGISVVAVTTRNGFLNAGGAASLLLAVGGCPEGPVLAADLVVVFGAPGTLCIAPSLDNNRRVTVDCSQTYPQAWNIDWVGYTNAGDMPCGGGTLCDAALEPSTWAGVKGRFRGE